MAPATTRPLVTVEVWSDVQCIWCYIASARFDRAVRQLNADVNVIHRSFQLQPDAPVEIDEQTLHERRSRFPSEQRERVFRQLREMTAAEDLPYDPDRSQPTNSRLALELLHHAEVTGHRHVLTDRLFRAYFAEGRHIGHLDELISLATEAGMDPTAARLALADHRYAAAIDRDIQRAHEMGAQGVPFYVINSTWGISGAQTPEAFRNALAQAANI
ncbi:DsbA family oxidoreductase [Chloroflexia bacterium SDU3-3]|nr:DsbA family oxidoreductase [Chloroflexia bacterium SDU3-3]